MSILLRDGLVNQSVDHVLEDLLVRFVINVPDEDLSSMERVFFQVEEAQWFYTDFVRVLNPQLPSMKMKSFAPKILSKCPMLWKWGDPADALSGFGRYKQTIPVRGVAMLNHDFTKVVLVKDSDRKTWSFPRGKISKDEGDLECAIRETREETGFDCREYVSEGDILERTIYGKNFKIYVARGVPEGTKFEPQVRNEIDEIRWVSVKSLQKSIRNNPNKYFVVDRMLKPLVKWISQTSGSVSEEELMRLAEVKLKALMGISDSEPTNADAGRELLDILQGAKPAVEAQTAQPATQQLQPQQFVQMSLPQHLQSLYSGLGHVPQFFSQVPQAPGHMHAGPPTNLPEFFNPQYGGNAPAYAQPPAQIQQAKPNESSANSKELLSILRSKPVKKADPQPVKPSLDANFNRATELLSILKQQKPRKDNSEVSSTASDPALSRSETPKKITLLKRDKLDTDSSATLMGILGKKPPSPVSPISQHGDPEVSNPTKNAPDFLRILNGKKASDTKPATNQSASTELLGILNRAPQNATPKDLTGLQSASAEILGVLHQKQPALEQTSRQTHDLPSAPVRLAKRGEDVTFQSAPPSSESKKESLDEEFQDFEDFEDFADLDNYDQPQSHIYDAIAKTLDDSSDEEYAEEHHIQEPTPSHVNSGVGGGQTNSAGAGLLLLLNGGRPPQSQQTSLQDTYGAFERKPFSPPQVQPAPREMPSNGAHLLLLLKRGAQ